MTDPARAEWDDPYGEPLSDLAREMPIDLDKFQAIMRQGRAARLELGDLAAEHRESRDRLRTLEAELADHPYGPYARHPPRPELAGQIEAARARVTFAERELARVQDQLISRSSVSAKCEDYARRRGIAANLDRTRAVPYRDAMPADAAPPDPAPADPLPIDAPRGGRP